MVKNERSVSSCFSDGLAQIVVEILLFFSLKNKRLQRIAGKAPKKN